MKGSVNGVVVGAIQNICDVTEEKDRELQLRFVCALPRVRNGGLLNVR
jgi:hypothetical protein